MRLLQGVDRAMGMAQRAVEVERLVKRLGFDSGHVRILLEDGAERAVVRSTPAWASRWTTR